MEVETKHNVHDPWMGTTSKNDQKFVISPQFTPIPKECYILFLPQFICVRKPFSVLAPKACMTAMVKRKSVRIKSQKVESNFIPSHSMTTNLLYDLS